MVQRCKFSIELKNFPPDLSGEPNDAKRTLTIDARRGCYEGMLDERKFTVRMPDGSEKTVLYKGKKINVKFEYAA